MASTSTSTKTPLSLPTKDLYARWAKVYDTDGNILQQIDNHQLTPLLTQAFTLPPSHPLTIIELGAGTGRNTLKLLEPRDGVDIKKIHALDLSSEMLELAKSRCASPLVSFHEFDALLPSTFPSIQELHDKADLVLSTLVLEHLPLSLFFQTVKKFLRLGGMLVLSNMHAEMGGRSRAGFMDGDGKEKRKVQGESFLYEVGEVVEAGREEGFVVVGRFEERGVEEEDLKQGRVGERGKKWVGCKVWFGGVMRLDRCCGL